ncbi:TrmH family RNA methyltransferase [Corynebacterium auriscanis]|uniref:TrmH family RNA methyltransferase n=1 Tax=Corynebacterium auriscanis TaxID=99807 RepID=UPI0022482A61|nr:RNA methyltransferase [Corynebacterium auriscanis]MCX2164130.1 RNA methyltransferase [Corynebacterium auriscanis]
MTSTWFEPHLIEDPSDYRLDDIRDLNSSDSRPDLPGGKGLVIAEGNLVVPRLLGSRYPVRTIVGFGSKLATLERQLRAEGFFSADAPTALHTRPPQVLEVSREVLRRVAGFDMHRGLVAAADRVEELGVDEVLNHVENSGTETKVVAVLEGVGDHENIGALFRNAAGLSVDAVLFGAATADPLYRRSVRVSMGHVLRIPFARFAGKTTTWQRSLSTLQERGYTVIALTPNTEQSLTEAVGQARRNAAAAGREARIAIMVGAEGPGLTEHAMRAADIRAAIPMAPGTDSLNVATAAAIGFYAARL